MPKYKLQAGDWTKLHGSFASMRTPLVTRQYIYSVTNSRIQKLITTDDWLCLKELDGAQDRRRSLQNKAWIE